MLLGRNRLATLNVVTLLIVFSMTLAACGPTPTPAPTVAPAKATTAPAPATAAATTAPTKAAATTAPTTAAATATVTPTVAAPATTAPVIPTVAAPPTTAAVTPTVAATAATAPTTITATAATTETAPSESAAPTGSPIKIGLEGPMTGDMAYEGQGFEKAVTLLVKQTNEAGGLLGRPVELVIDDDKGDPKEAALVADRMVNAGVVAVIGGYNSTATEAASQIYDEAGLLHVTPSSTAVRLTEKGFQRFFRVCFLDDRQGLFAARFATEILKAKKIGILHDNSTYAKGLADETQKYLEEKGTKAEFFDAINPDDQDFTPILTKLKGAGLDVVFFTGYHAQGGLLLKQSADVGLKVQWMMGNASNNPELIQIAGLDKAKGAIIVTEPLPSDLPYPEAKQFNADFEKAYNEAPKSVWWIMAADAFNVIKYAIGQTKSTDSKVLAEFLHGQFKNQPGITGPILGFDEKGDRLGTIHKAYVIDNTGDIVPNAEQPTESS